MLTPIGPDGKPLAGNLLGLGRTGLVIRKDDKAFKVALAFDTTGLTESTCQDLEILCDQSRSALRNEMSVYQHLGNHAGIVEWFGVSEAGIEMAYIEKGNLEKYITKSSLSPILKLRWVKDAAETISYVHSKGVVICDIATRNFLVSDNLSLLLCDFGESSIIGSDYTIDERDIAIKIDIAQFGSVIYEISTGVGHSFQTRNKVYNSSNEDISLDTDDENARRGCNIQDFNSNEVERCGEDSSNIRVVNDDEECNGVASRIIWPGDDELPVLECIPLGRVIHNCWARDGYQNMNELCIELANIESWPSN